MAFGFGKKDKEQTPPAQGQQISPEALALLEQMAAANSGAAPQQPIPQQPVPQQPVPQQPVPQQPQAQPVQAMQPPMGAEMSPQMAAAHQMAQQMAPQMTAPISTPMNGEMDAEFRAPVMPGAADAQEPSDGKKRKKAKKSAKVKLTREEKKLAAKQAKEEKERVKRRKKLSKSRFSRARYLREANGNAIAGLALWIFMIVVFIAGPFVLNTHILLPQTRANNDVVNQISQLEDTVSRSRPQIELAVRNKSDRENELKSKTGTFASAETVKTALERFIADLKANNIEFDEGAPAIITPQDIGVSGLVGQTLSLSIRADFITYLRIRNKFVSSMRSIRISNETIQAEPGDPVMSIQVTITVPSKVS